MTVKTTESLLVQFFGPLKQATSPGRRSTTFTGSPAGTPLTTTAITTTTTTTAITTTTTTAITTKNEEKEHQQ